METTTKLSIGSGAAGILAVIAIVMNFGLIGEENVYVCLDNERAMQCPKGLSNVNADGIQTRCKFFSEELNRSTYKICKTGWIPYEPTKKPKLTGEKIYLVCQKTNDLISECSIIDSNETIFKISN